MHNKSITDTDPSAVRHIRRTTAMIITYKEILAILNDNPNFERLLMFDRVFRGDDDFFVPASEWYKKEFFPWYELQLRHYHVRGYTGSWDCDKYAGALNLFGNICHAQTSPRKSESLAIAEIHYLPDNSVTRHAINAVIIDDNQLKFIEPQKPEFIKLSPSEQRSITFMKF
jgi:hypothetical protein